MSARSFSCAGLAVHARTRAGTAVVLILVVLYGLGMGWLSVERHLALRTNAEDLGFTDQVIWNFLRGQAFRFSLYERAEWETDIDLAAIRRPDSLLAFHVEPLLMVFVPLYAVIPDVRALLWIQAGAVALGMVPAYRLARRRLGSEWAGLAAALTYALVPFGPWAVLADFHTVTLTAPLLMGALDALDDGRPRLFLATGLLAVSAKEEIGLVFAGLGLLALARPGMRTPGLVALAFGAGWSLLCIALIIPHYSGGAISPFTARYAHLGDTPVSAAWALVERPSAYLEALARREVTEYLVILLLAGGWVALLAPELLMPVGIVLALNVFSSSPWMASGRAHYSASVVPFLVAAAVVGAARISRALGPRHLRLANAVPAAIVLGAVLAYHRAGAGPLADGFALPLREPRHELAARLAASIPTGAPVSASSSLVPHLSQRPSVYLFPTLRDADYVIVDVAGDPYPISAGGVHRRLGELLERGEFRVLAADEGIVLLEREAAATRPLPDGFLDFVRADELPSDRPAADIAPDQSGRDVGGARTFLDGALTLVSAGLRPSGVMGPNGPLGTLETVWTVDRPLAVRPRPSFQVHLRDGTQRHVYDLAAVWWYPPERWQPGELVRIDAPDLPLRDVVYWDADVTLDVERLPAPLDGDARRADSGGERAGGNADAAGEDQATVKATDSMRIAMGELIAHIERDPLRVSLLDPAGMPFWAGPSGSSSDPTADVLRYRDRDGHEWRAVRLLDAVPAQDGVTLLAATDDPSGRTARLTFSSLGPRSVRASFSLSEPAGVAAIGGATTVAAGEHVLGFGERFHRVNQRGRLVRTWAEDRRDAGFGDATYAPIPFYISSRGYSFLIESDARGQFDVARSRSDRITWDVEQPSVSVVLSYGPSPRELVSQQARHTGLPPLPPIWAFGVWKTAVGGQDRVLRDAERLRDERLPVTGLFVYDAADREALLGWPHVVYGQRGPGPYPDVKAMNDRLHALGYKSLGYKSPEVARHHPEYADLASRDYLIRRPGGEPYVHPRHHVAWLDLTAPHVVTWWATLWHRILLDLGFDGAMLDLAEIVPEDAHYADGSMGTETHNRYLGLFARASFEAARAVRGDDFALFARSGSLGAQRYQSLQWPGDQTITWDQEGIGGLIPAGLSMGLSGFPYWHPEVGGFVGVGLPADSERELWFRWLQLGALSPLLRDQYGEHRGEPVEAWTDAETVAAFRDYARLHNSLVPYLYTQARIASETGLPIMRHLALIAPDDPRAWEQEDSYTLGDDLLVAPVLQEGARLRTLYLPPGTWVDWWTGELWDGGRTITVEAPLDRIPLFARAGAILPLAPDFDTLAPTTEPGTVTWNGDLIVRVVRPGDATGRWGDPTDTVMRLYDGTTLGVRFERGKVQLSVASAPAERGYAVRLPAPSGSTPRLVTLNNEAIQGWTFEDGLVGLDVRATEFTVTIVAEE